MGPMQYNGVLLCHGSPYDEDEYVFTEFHAAQILSLFEAPVILYGHTHLPVAFGIDRSSRMTGVAVRGERNLPAGNQPTLSDQPWVRRAAEGQESAGFS